MLTHRERVLRAFRFEKTDRLPYDMMEQSIGPQLLDYFRKKHGLQDEGQVLDFLDTDFRWCGLVYHGPEEQKPDEDLPDEWGGTYSDALYRRPLAEVKTVVDVEAFQWPNPPWWEPDDYAGLRAKWPHHALVFCTGWMPLFCGACRAFGMEAALVNLMTEPALFEAFVRHQHEFYMELLMRALPHARGACDICWLGDDYAGMDNLIIDPTLWRKYIMPYLARQVRCVREHDMYVLFHSCGAVDIA